MKNIEFAVIIGDGLTIRGGEGANTVFAGAGSQNIVLGEDDDELHGGDGDDTLFGGAGNDSLWGGEGTDTIQLQGKFSEYTINHNTDGGYIIEDRKANRDDKDMVYEFEQFQFLDIMLTKQALDARLEVDPNGIFNKQTKALASFSWIWDALA